MRVRGSWPLLGVLLFSIAPGRASLYAQSGEAVFARVSESIFSLQVRDPSGELKGSATGFLIASDLVLTNSHVSALGQIFVRVGPIEVPCRVEREDHLNDLALCRLQARTSTDPLHLASAEPQSGGRVLTVGNPKGLEKTISEGMVSGRRQIEGAERLQISAPISPGSSGGPVLSLTGEVVGVVVGSLTGGQNLNFAVPLSVVRGFVEGKANAATAAEVIAEANVLAKRRDSLTYSDAPDSDWAKNEARLHALLLQAVDLARDADVLLEVQPMTAIFDFDAAVAIARKVISLRKAPRLEDYHRLAYSGYMAADDGAPDEKTLLAEAEKAARRAIELGGGRVFADVKLLGDIQTQQKRLVDAAMTYAAANAIAKSEDELRAAAFSLFVTNRSLDKKSEAAKWLGVASAHQPSPYQMASFAEFWADQDKFAESGYAYWQAYLAAPTNYKWACEAGAKLWNADKVDDSLTANRKCLELVTAKKGSDQLVGRAHRLLADDLLQRGVYEEAISHAQDAIAVDATDEFANETLGRAYEAVRRFDDAVSVLKTVIRLSDGKYGSMHFHLGAAYFELKRWPEAAQAYQKAAELLPTNADAAFNVAVSFYNDHQYSAAIPWYREVLRRSPNYPDRAAILATLAKIGG